MTNGSPAYEIDDYTGLIEDLVFLIRQSCAVQLGRVEAYLDGVVLAAEQVQDIRIKILETPEEVTGWEFVGNILLTFALESTIGGKLLAAVTKKIFTPILRQHAVFMALPKSPYGQELKRQAQRIARMNAPRAFRLPGSAGSPSVPLIRSGRAAEAISISAVLQRGAGGPGLAALGRENVQLYHASLEALIRGSGETQQNLAAAAKAVREAIQRPGPTEPASLGASDTAGVAILAAAQQYAAVTRLGIQARHARFEQLVRGYRFMPADLGILGEMFDWEDLNLDVDGRRVAPQLSEIRGRYRMLFEAVIWAGLYGFDPNRKTPQVQQNRAEFEGIPKPLANYWRERFAAAIDIWNEIKEPFSGIILKTRYRGKFAELDPALQIRYLAEYFWAISKALPRLADAELKQRVVP